MGVDPYAPQDLRARTEMEIDSYSPQELRARTEMEIDSYSPQELRARTEMEIDPYAPQELRARTEMEIDPYAPQELRARIEMEIDPYAPQELRARTEMEIDPYAPQELRTRTEMEIEANESQGLPLQKKNFNKKDLNNFDIDRESDLKLNQSDLENPSSGLIDLHKQDESASLIAFQSHIDQVSELEQINNQNLAAEISRLPNSISRLSTKPKSFSNSELPSLEFLRAELQTNTLKITQELIKNIDKTLIASLLIQNYKHIASIMANPPVVNSKNGLDNLVSAVKYSNTHSQI
jgi:hypothetical protein